MEGSTHSQYLMWMKRNQILTSHLQIGSGSSWEERAFAEDAARILSVGGSIWPPRSYSCNFCKREFRSAQALGGHMNIHRRDRARLKQNLSPHSEVLALDHRHHHHQKSSLGNHFSADCYLKPCSFSRPAETTSRSVLPFSSSIIWGQKMGSTNSEADQGVVVNAKVDNFKDVETSLSVGLTSMFGQKSPIVPCGDSIICCKRQKTTTISSLPVFLKPCSKPAEIVGIEDLDLELRLGKQQKVK